MNVCHKCDNPKCCNPEHLFLGTKKENTKDMCDKGRNFRARGELCGASKLTNSDVLYIRAEFSAQRMTQKDLAQKFNIHQSAISRIVHGKRWAHI
jgi:ribosome-binding protein aMBF1 (putative translation factor)